MGDVNFVIRDETYFKAKTVQFAVRCFFLTLTMQKDHVSIKPEP